MYVSLDDDDGIAGVAAVRSSSSTLPELILEYESIGMYVGVQYCIAIYPDSL